MAIAIIPIIQKLDHSKSWRFCPDFKRFLTTWQLFVHISNGWACRYNIPLEILTICKPILFLNIRNPDLSRFQIPTVCFQYSDDYCFKFHCLKRWFFDQIVSKTWYLIFLNILFQVPIFLLISGSFTCLVGVLRIFQMILIRFKALGNCATITCQDFRQSSAFVAELGLLIWGTVILAGNFSDWTWLDLESEYFCQREALGLLSFVVIFNWLIPVLMCFGCCGITVFCIFSRRPSFFEQAVNNHSRCTENEMRC